MPKETMSPRERWLAVLNRQTPDRVPMDIWITPEAAERLQAHMGCDWDAVIERLHIDPPMGVGGRYIGPPPEEGKDIWGVEHAMVDYGTGAYQEAVTAPLARFKSVEEIEANYTWPNPDHWDYSHLPEQIRGNEHRIIRGGGSEPVYQYKFLRGDHQAFMDFLEHPDIAHYCIDRIFEIAYQDTLRIFETIPGQVSITYVAEDLGGQDGLMYAPETLREFVFPGMKRMMDLTRQNGSFVFTHSDGSFREVIPELIEMGMQVLNPVQWRCRGMEREGLKRDFGAQLVFHGGVDNQYTLPFGTVEEVRREVLDNYRILGAGGGYILAPCHNIQSVSPPENIVALYETGYEYGWQS
ncbi:MAG TPA: uroporphyrinogen decarboxylase family protein [Candidatus Hydrogenedentes bacterium]|nr:uroporphyrinogen decarboxylase family protein [Candidatus Hydrogenedentota bacterium]HOV74180.1 uroporphyrinogen decarboxylase family protein [Candidatus Hydrogenedentota bacterium]HPC15719.1 uroporphyrinogen decarboxylase family protein [Candidatus Hydrogenedentota bacterium]HRT19657.1 uroporphyrinogen decarboxylase family protein [Candidatus Hydrogenedentota bacterium]HRT64431.1 uroporphyrinogen decarboxylase family protein [Candidatus Hydrogenedentota bacterium]